MAIQFILVAIFGLAAFSVWRRAVIGHVGYLSAVMWTVIWTVATVVVLKPELASSLAQRLGVGRGVDAVVYLSIAALFFLVFRLFLRQQKIERELTSLISEMALRDLPKK